MRHVVAGIVTILVASGCTHLGVSCASEDRLCKRVRDQLATVAANRGGWCGTPRVGAAMRLHQLGDFAVPYLTRALPRADDDIAAFVAETLIDMGHEHEVRAWCAGRRRCPVAAN